MINKSGNGLSKMLKFRITFHYQSASIDCMLQNMFFTAYTDI